MREDPNERALENARSLQRLNKKWELENKMKNSRKRIKRVISVDNLKNFEEIAHMDSMQGFVPVSEEVKINTYRTCQ